jgi:hypothetical protein
MAIEVSWIQLAIPEHAPGAPINPNDPLFGRNPACGCGCGCQPAGCPPPAPRAPKAAKLSTRYGTGEVILTASDVHAKGYGTPWGHTRSFASRLSADTNVGNGNNWQVREWSYLIFPSPGTVVVMGDANEALYFDLSGSAFVPRFSVRQTLVLNAAANVYELVDLDGSITQYNAVTGAFIQRSDPAGNTVAVVSYLANGFNFTEVQRTVTADGVTTVESYLYTYQDPAANFPLLTSVLLRRQVNGGDWTNVLQAQYAYYGSGDPNGNLNDLQTVVTQSWSNGALLPLLAVPRPLVLQLLLLFQFQFLLGCGVGGRPAQVRRAAGLLRPVERRRRQSADGQRRPGGPLRRLLLRVR